MSQLLAWIAADPLRMAALIGGLVALIWKALPIKQRTQLEYAYPRIVGVIRVIYSLAPDVIKAGESGFKNVVKGQPKLPDIVTVEVKDEPSK